MAAWELPLTHPMGPNGGGRRRPAARLPTPRGGLGGGRRVWVVPTVAQASLACVGTTSPLGLWARAGPDSNSKTYRSGRFSPALPGAGPREGDRRAQPRPATCNGEENVGARVGCVQWGRSAPALLRAGPRWGDRRTLPHPATSLHGWASPPRHLCVHQLGTLVYKVGHTDGVLMQESMD